MWLRALSCLVLLCSTSAPCHAGGPPADPFAEPPSEWISLDDYQSKEVVADPAVPPPAPEAVVEPSAPAQPEGAATQETPPPAKDGPQAKVSYPVMPTSLGSGVIVTTTEDEKEAIAIQEKKEWQDLHQAEEEARKQEQAKAAVEKAKKGETQTHMQTNAQKDNPFGVRFTTLPSSKIQSVPAERISKPKLEREAKAAALRAGKEKPAETAKEEEKKKTATKESSEACEAFADYRRRQLDAIESDRKTLADLRAALAELGLVNKLSFMTGQDGSLVQPVDANGTARTDQKAPATQTP